MVKKVATKPKYELRVPRTRGAEWDDPNQPGCLDPAMVREIGREFGEHCDGILGRLISENGIPPIPPETSDPDRERWNDEFMRRLERCLGEKFKVAPRVYQLDAATLVKVKLSAVQPREEPSPFPVVNIDLLEVHDLFDSTFEVNFAVMDNPRSPVAMYLEVLGSFCDLPVYLLIQIGFGQSKAGPQK